MYNLKCMADGSVNQLPNMLLTLTIPINYTTTYSVLPSKYVLFPVSVNVPICSPAIFQNVTAFWLQTGVWIVQQIPLLNQSLKIASPKTKTELTGFLTTV